MRYYVFDSVGKLLRSFPTYKAALAFKTVMGRWDWKIVEVKQ